MNANKITMALQILCVATVAILLAQVSNLKREVRRYVNDSEVRLIPPLDNRVALLNRSGVNWSVEQDDTNVWITVESTNQPSWNSTNGILMMKKLPPTILSPTKQLE